MIAMKDQKYGWRIFLHSPSGTSIIKHGAKETIKKIPIIGWIITGIDEGRTRYELEIERQMVLERLFGTSTPVYVVGSNAHPIYNLLPGEIVYPSDKIAMERIKYDLFRDIEFQKVEDELSFIEQGSLISLGSSAATKLNRYYLGNPEAPKVDIVLKKYKTHLRYTYVAPDKNIFVKSYQFGRNKPWKEPNWGIMKEDDFIFPSIRKGWLYTDYLLVTRIPNDIMGAGDVMIIGGCHGVGTQATELLLRSIDLRELKNVINKIEDSYHYQALFEVHDISHEGGHSSGKLIKLVDAKPLKINWER